MIISGLHAISSLQVFKILFVFMKKSLQREKPTEVFFTFLNSSVQIKPDTK